ncbi:MAG: SUMF1/EgtB/PvdO family nonheme iron enzyme, partial [Gemmatimonadaceae bacterium]
MSPEQALGERVDTRTDLWSLGVVLYEALSGRAPFSGENPWALLRAISQDTPAPLSSLRTGIPPYLDALVTRAMERDVSRRYQSAADLSRDASAALSTLSAAMLRPTNGPSEGAQRWRVLVAALVLVVLGVAAWTYRQSERRTWARDVALPRVDKLLAADRPLAAWKLFRDASQYLPRDSALGERTTVTTQNVTVISTPPGANVEIADYLTPDSGWYALGTTPLKTVGIPRGYYRWRVKRAGKPDYIVAPPNSDTMHFALDSADAAPNGTVYVGASASSYFVGFIGWIGPYRLPAAYLDRYEVTNRQYQQFVDAGGYREQRFWHEPFREKGRALQWSEAIARFRDKSGRAGPATWEGGHFPEGQADFPVSGVSWFEASAYAVYVGASLPTFAQWFQAGAGHEELARFTVQVSNIGQSAVAPVGRFTGVGPYGSYDLAGNVREWATNAVDEDTRFLLGGGWSSLSYLYVDPEALSPYDRSPLNGFRCIRNLGPLPPNVVAPVSSYHRDFTKSKGVSDDVFRAYRLLYGFGNSPLNAKTSGIIEEGADWKKEKVSFDAAYGNERLTAYIFLPKHVKPPYSTVLFSPSARVLDIPNSATLGDVDFFDYVVKSGRAVMYPVFQDTYERRTRGSLPGGERDVLIDRAKDVRRSLDYLETRTDVDHARLGYLGVSMGAAEGVLYTTLEQSRLQAIVFLDGGFFLSPPSDGTDQADFAPRLTKPVLMVNGRYDFSFPYDRSQLPLFRMLGTPATDKRHVVLETPHDVRARRGEMVSAVLEWLDRYLGRVE